LIIDGNRYSDGEGSGLSEKSQLLKIFYICCKYSFEDGHTRYTSLERGRKYNILN